MQGKKMMAALFRFELKEPGLLGLAVLLSISFFDKFGSQFYHRIR
jgi:hypothetical protein